MVAAVAVRLWSAYHARLSFEEASFWNTAVGIARGEYFPRLGHPVSGSHAAHPGPLFFWVIAASQVFVVSPLVANFFVSSFGLFGALALARAMPAAPAPAPAASATARADARTGAPGVDLPSRVGLAQPGTLFFLLVLTAPWWIVYTNSTWPGYLFPGACACFVAALLRVIGKARSRAALPLGFILVAGFQIHLSLLHFWPLALAVAGVYRPRLNRRLVLAGAALGAACYIPYFASEIASGFANTKLLLAKSQGGGRRGDVLAGLYLYFLGFPTTDVSYLWQQGFWSPFDHVRFWRGGGVDRTTAFFRTAGPPALLWAAHVVTWLFSVAALLTGAFRLVAGWRRGRRRPEPLTLLYLVGLIDIALFYGMSGKGGYAHYVSVILPLAFVPVVSFLAWIARARGGRVVVGAYLGLAAVGGLGVLRGYYRVDSRWSAPQSERVVAFILDRTRGAPVGAGDVGAAGPHQPFQLNVTFSPSWPYTYQVLAQRLHHAAWMMQGNAPAHRFVVGAQPTDGAVLPRAPDRLDLETIFVAGR